KVVSGLRAGDAMSFSSVPCARIAFAPGSPGAATVPCGAPQAAARTRAGSVQPDSPHPELRRKAGDAVTAPVCRRTVGCGKRQVRSPVGRSRRKLHLVAQAVLGEIRVGDHL